jgi:hypothetical protein
LAKVRKIPVSETLRKVSGISNSMGIMGTLFWPRFFALVFFAFLRLQQVAQLML